MNYAELTKKLDLQAPHELKYDELRAKTLTRDDLKADTEGIDSSIELIRNTRGGSWPSEPATKDTQAAVYNDGEIKFASGDPMKFGVKS